MSTHTLSPKSSSDSLHSTVSAVSSPDKLAPAVAGPMAWEELDPSKYVVELSPSEVQDIRAAVIKIKSKNAPNYVKDVANREQSLVHHAPRSDKTHSTSQIQA